MDSEDDWQHEADEDWELLEGLASCRVEVRDREKVRGLKIDSLNSEK